MGFFDDNFAGTSLSPDVKNPEVALKTQETEAPEEAGFFGKNFTGTSLLDEPESLKNAKRLMSRPDENYNGLCQRFAEYAAWGKKNLAESAIQFWNDYPGKVDGLQGMKKGDLIYFSANPSNRFYGHTGIYEGNGKFISATDKGIRSISLDDWVNMTSQRPLGYIPT